MRDDHALASQRDPRPQRAVGATGGVPGTVLRRVVGGADARQPRVARREELPDEVRAVVHCGQGSARSVLMQAMPAANTRECLRGPPRGERGAESRLEKVLAG